MGQFVDLTNKQFNTIYVDKYLGHSKWACHCVVCGSQFVKESTQVKNYGCNNCWKAHADDNYFAAIDTPQKAYIFGFLWADGSTDPAHKKIKLDVQESDKDILETIKAELQWTGNITGFVVKRGDSYRPDDARVYRLAIVNGTLCQDLCAKGLVAHRENAHLPIEHVPREYVNDFIRGYFDGNGTISKHVKNRRTPQWMVSICGGDTIIKDIGEWLQAQYGYTVKYYPRRPENPNNNTLTLTRSADIRHFLTLLYGEPNTLHLERKYKKYLEYINPVE